MFFGSYVEFFLMWEVVVIFRLKLGEIFGKVCMVIICGFDLYMISGKRKEVILRFV